MSDTSYSKVIRKDGEFTVFERSGIEILRDKDAAKVIQYAIDSSQPKVRGGEESV